MLCACFTQYLQIKLMTTRLDIVLFIQLVADRSKAVPVLYPNIVAVGNETQSGCLSFAL